MPQEITPAFPPKPCLCLPAAAAAPLSCQLFVQSTSAALTLHSLPTRGTTTLQLLVSMSPTTSVLTVLGSLISASGEPAFSVEMHAGHVWLRFSVPYSRGGCPSLLSRQRAITAVCNPRNTESGLVLAEAFCHLPTDHPSFPLERDSKMCRHRGEKICGSNHDDLLPQRVHMCNMQANPCTAVVVVRVRYSSTRSTVPTSKNKRAARTSFVGWNTTNAASRINPARLYASKSRYSINAGELKPYITTCCSRCHTETPTAACIYYQYVNHACLHDFFSTRWSLLAYDTCTPPMSPTTILHYTPRMYVHRCCIGWLSPASKFRPSRSPRWSTVLSSWEVLFTTKSSGTTCIA